MENLEYECIVPYTDEEGKYHSLIERIDYETYSSLPGRLHIHYRKIANYPVGAREIDENYRIPVKNMPNVDIKTGDEREPDNNTEFDPNSI